MSIHKRSTGYGVAVYDPREKRKVWQGTRETLKEARRLERDRSTVMSKRRVRAGTVNDFARVWWEHYPRREPTTNRHNRQILKAFFARFGERKLDDIGRAEARAWAVEHPHTAKVVSAFYNDAIDAEAVEVNPFSKLRLEQSKGRSNIVPLTEQDVSALADAALEVFDAFYGPTFRALVLFAAYTGVRPGELAGLTWRDVDLGQCEVLVERQVRPDGTLALPKENRVRRILVPPPARDALTSIMPPSLPWLFPTVTGKRMRRGSLNYSWRRVRDMAGRPTVDLYELRHFAASHMADMGMTARDMSEQLGNSPEVCERVYVHSYEGRWRDRLRAAYGVNVSPLREHLGSAGGGVA